MGKRYIILLAVILIGFVGLVVWSKNNASSDDGANKNIGSLSQNYYGNLDSKITFTEYVDFQCEACYEFYFPLKEVKEKYKDKIKFQVSYFPIEGGDHKFSRIVARSAHAAAIQGKFWEMHDKIFKDQKIWEISGDPQKYLDQYASELGLDVDKFKKDYADTTTDGVINADQKKAKELGLTGTPFFMINGQKIEGLRPTVDSISSAIDKVIKNSSKN